MKDWKTTLLGAILAGLVAAKPLLDGSGYHFDNKTIAEVSFAFFLAAFGYAMQDARK